MQDCRRVYECKIPHSVGGLGGFFGIGVHLFSPVMAARRRPLLILRMAK
jgi:hypothetical protein